MDNKQRKQTQFSLIYFLIALVGMWLFQELIFRPYIIRQTEVPYSQFRQDLIADNIAEVTLGGERIIYTCCAAAGEDRLGRTYNVVAVEDPNLIQDLVDAGVQFRAEPPASNLLTALLGWILPLLPLALIWYFLLRRMGQGGASVMSIGKSKAREIAGELTGVKFADVGGVDEVEVELKEIIEFLKDPQRFTRLGAKLPKGVLMVGPPGTGKTLLARATAGEAGVPFFSISGSDFVEMFVGVGAARVRDLFEQAKRRAPCIVFIDEMDAIGQARSTVGVIGSNDEREQTLNQLLAEMDGFEANQGVVIMAATNRPEILDPALLRPGRFDRQIQVTLPTEDGRRQILEIHTREVTLGEDVDLGRLAQITSGFSGADLANIVNEAALLAVRRDSNAVSMQDFDLAIERVIAGLQRKMPLKDEVKRKVAYHEGGHALVAQLLPHTDPVHKVSVIPTAKGALGYTMQMPEEDQYLLGQQELEERMTVMLGGRAAELLVFGEPSTGAANDLQRVTDLARRMVTEFGMTDSLGPVRYAAPAGSGYLQTQINLRQELSPETATLIDQETRHLVETAQQRATDLLRTHRAALDEVARVLQVREVINGDEIRRIVEETARE
ncbi:MAG TPA: ATP-dependent metallopeptidase FtsH/Yme1/Tma family protein [Chloroflexi bacterium]|nr:ATP-dependent metallopeptidase FtsH/Yme1/Tma family protein [Chloroflexota bacterium]